MPTYGYECTSCRDQIEVFQSIKDDPLTTCESCGGALRKRIYPVGIAFKGSGFYVNDYARKSDGGGSSEAGADTPKVDAAKTETPKSDTAQSDTAKSETPKAETKADAPKTEAAASGA